MERKPKEQLIQAVVDEDPLIWMQNKGGTFRIAKNRIIKPNQTFQARLSEIKSAFRDIVVPVAPRPTAEKTAPKAPEKSRPGKVQAVFPVDPASSVYKAVRVGETDYWDIVDPLGKVVSEQPIETEAEALELAARLSS